MGTDEPSIESQPADQAVSPPVPTRLSRFTHQVTFASAQIRILTVILAILIAYGGVRLLLSSSYIADPQPAEGDLAAQLATKLDPNTATAAELAALPGLGDKRAALIVERRETVLKREPTTVPYRTIEDLYPIKGIGGSMIGNLRPYLTFPTTNSARDIDQTAP